MRRRRCPGERRHLGRSHRHRVRSDLRWRATHLISGAASGRGEVFAAGRCRHGVAMGAGGGRGRQGTVRAGRRRVLHRVRRLPPFGAPPGLSNTAVLRRPARANARTADDRGGVAEGVPHAPGPVGSDQGATPSAPSQLWDRVGSPETKASGGRAVRLSTRSDAVGHPQPIQWSRTCSSTRVTAAAGHSPLVLIASN
jgi:hypothetical protein